MLMIRSRRRFKVEERVGTEVGVALRGLVEALCEREEPQTIDIAVGGVDPALSRALARTARRRHPRRQPSLKSDESGSGRQVSGSGLPNSDSRIT